MARYTDESRERARDAVDFVALVEERVPLRRAGADRMTGLCPFHEERSPSFGISPQRKVFHCFGCGEGGDVFRFVQLTQGLGFSEALEEVARRAGVELEVVEEDPAAAKRRQERERLHELLERTAAYYVRYLWSSEEAAPARAYLAERGLEEATLREFRVGFAPSRYDAILRAVRQAGFSSHEAWDAGLVTRSQEGGRLYDRFRRRITFPLTDVRGRVLGFGARAMTEGRGPKYLNSNDNAVFRKGRNLFGADIARPHAAKGGEVLLAEGYTDVLALHQAGLRNAVGLMGTALTEEQVEELARLAPVVLLALDADSAGQEAMLRAARVAQRRKLELRVVPLPEGLDPADLVLRQGPDAIRELAARSVPFVRFRVEHVLATADLSGAEGKDKAIDALRPVFASIPPSAMREDLIALVAARTDLQPALVGSWLAATEAGRSGPSGAPGSAAPSRAATSPPRSARADAGRGQGGRGSGAPGGRTGHRPGPAIPAPAAANALAPAARAERSFLSQCLALPQEGAARLAELDLEATFREDVTRRAAAVLRDHATDPVAAVPPDDDELNRLVAQLAVRAERLEPSPASLDAELLKLELLQVERDLQRGGGDATALAGRREALRRRLDVAITAALEQGAR